MSGRKGIDWGAQPLGQLPDSELARQLGVSQSVVTRARRRRDIEPFSRIDWDAVPLGQATDAALAKALDVPATTVQYARSSRGIAPFADHAVRPARLFARDMMRRIPIGGAFYGPARQLALLIFIGRGTVSLAEIRDGLELPQATASDLVRAAIKTERVIVTRTHGTQGGLGTLVKLAPKAIRELKSARGVDGRKAQD